METLIAEDLLLLLLDDEKGTIAGVRQRPAPARRRGARRARPRRAVDVEEKHQQVAVGQGAPVAGAAAARRRAARASALATVAEKERSGPGPGRPARQGGRASGCGAAGRARHPRATEGPDPRPVPRTRWPAVDSATSTRYAAAARRCSSPVLSRTRAPRPGRAAGRRSDQRTRRSTAAGCRPGRSASGPSRSPQGDWAAKAVKDAIAGRPGGCHGGGRRRRGRAATSAAADPSTGVAAGRAQPRRRCGAGSGGGSSGSRW